MNHKQPLPGIHPATAQEVIHPVLKIPRRSLPDGASLLLRMHRISDDCVSDLRNLARDREASSS